MKLSTLRKQAQRGTAFRGHSMRWHAPYGRANGPLSQLAECRRCGRGVALNEYPAPNGIEIGGEAVALTCEVQS